MRSRCEKGFSHQIFRGHKGQGNTLRAFQFSGMRYPGFRSAMHWFPKCDARGATGGLSASAGPPTALRVLSVCASSPFPIRYSQFPFRYSPDRYAPHFLRSPRKLLRRSGILCGAPRASGRAVLARYDGTLGGTKGYANDNRQSKIDNPTIPHSPFVASWHFLPVPQLDTTKINEVDPKKSTCETNPFET